MSNININGVNFYYELHGSGDPMVLIGGLKADHSGWMPVLEMLAKDNTVLIFDNRGSGQTMDDGEPFDVATMADDTMSIVNKLGLSKPHVVGHSLGGAVAQVIAHKYADDIKSVTLCNSFVKFNEQAKSVFSSTLDIHRSGKSQADIMDSIVPWVFSNNFLSPEVIEIIRKSSNDNPYPQSLSGYERQLEALYSFDANSWIDDISVPVLVIGADEDKVALPSESHELAFRIKNSRLVTLSAGHASQVEKPIEFVSSLQDFIRNLTCTRKFSC